MAKASPTKRKLRYPLRVLLPVALIAVAVAFGTMQLLQTLENRVSVENRSAVPLTAVEVILGEQDLQFGPLPAPGLAEKRFTIAGDSRFTVKVTSSNGSVFKAQGGYVTRGFYGARVKIVVHPDWIEIVQSAK